MQVQTTIVQKEKKIDEKLKSYITSIEKLEEEKKETSQQISEIYKTAKTHGFSVPTMKKIIRLRKTSPDERIEAQSLLECYCEALGMPVQMDFSF